MRKVVGLGHQARVGKDTAAQILVDKYGFKRLAFADLLKEMAMDIDPMIGIGVKLAWHVENFGWEETKSMPEARRFLQALGLAARENLSEDVWVRPIIETILYEKDQDFVVTDVRFPNEFDMLWMLDGAQMVKLIRPGVESNAGTHVSETALQGYGWDHLISNDGTIDDLEAQLVEALVL